MEALCKGGVRADGVSSLIVAAGERNTKRELYDGKLEDALEMLDLKWSKDDDTKTQCNQLNTCPLYRGNAFNKNNNANNATH